jgi:hypothetical protein
MLKTVSSITNAIGALNFKGTWNATTNTPALASGAGTKGDYYVVSVAGSTALDGISNWGVGDWAAFNGSVWQRVEGGADLNGVNLSVSGTSTLSGLTASTALALDASKNVVSVTNTGTGSNVLADAPTLTGTTTVNGLVRVSSTAANWAATGGVIDLGLGSAIFNPNSTGQTWFYTNAYFDSGAKYKAAGEATWYQQVAGAHNWYGSAAGAAAGDPITFILNGALDNAGNYTITGATATKASGTTWANPSDVRLKDNIQDYVKGSAELMQIRVCEWEYNGKGGTTQGMKGLGVIADEVMTVLPNTVQNYKAKLNAKDEEVTEIKKFDATEITWLLVKTVQEQQSTIAALTARVAALESA